MSMPRPVELRAPGRHCRQQRLRQPSRWRPTAAGPTRPTTAQAAIQQLGAGRSINDSFTAVSSDGTASQVVTVTITGTNDVPVIGGRRQRRGAARTLPRRRDLSDRRCADDCRCRRGRSNFTVSSRAPPAAMATAASRWRPTATGATRPTTARRRSSSWAPAAVDQRQLHRCVVRRHGQPGGDGDHHRRPTTCR